MSSLDRQHYHYVIAGSGIADEGDHTLDCNTGSIRISLAGMAGAVEAPVSPQPWSITEAQLLARAWHKGLSIKNTGLHSKELKRGAASG
ncbi:hypothetical protein [Paracoccus sp. PAR01]|uniref:hypothetical protein n=1 Tax=Paracoccus sp. PAR01 TaxID=2769282 RepID=UPI00177FFD83|nr:hypothetical protein [Paracoccus sp. PAR01]MBD9528241.1 hypothetical protein [Paracoccus sp. PAR01]